jgi:hypothetical protein
MTAQTNVSIVWDMTINAYKLSSSFNDELRQFLSKQIPVSDRYWKADTREWIYVERQHKPILAFLALMGMSPTVVDRKTVEDQVKNSQQANQRKSGSNGASGSGFAVEFIRLIPFDIMQKAFRQTAMQLHPDKNGGDGSKMSELNSAWDKIQKEIYGK